MEQYIPKSTVVAEIERLDNYWHLSKNASGQAFVENLFSFLDTLEVKDIDLKKELSYEDYVGFFKEHLNFPDDWGFDEAWIFAKHFFELGLKAQKGE